MNPLNDYFNALVPDVPCLLTGFSLYFFQPFMCLPTVDRSSANGRLPHPWRVPPVYEMLVGKPFMALLSVPFYKSLIFILQNAFPIDIHNLRKRDE